MTIKDAKLRELGITLKRRAQQQSIDVDDSFVIELGNYARHKIVEQLDEDDTTIVLEKIGDKALAELGVLNSGAVWQAIHRICRPKNGYDLCVGAARNILNELGRDDAVIKLDSLKAKLLADWTLDE